MVETLPQLTYGKIVGRFLAAVGDGTDTDLYPDEVPLSGTITFTASAPVVTVATATPDPVTVFTTPITAFLDSNGYVSDANGNKGIFLIATDNAATNPTNFTYNVSYKLALAGGTPVTANSKDIPVLSGTTTDLVTVVSVPASGGTTSPGTGTGTGGAVSSVAGRIGAVVLTKSDVGLSNVDNTTDLAKPVSSAQQTALNLKANTASPAFTGTVTGLTAAMVGLGNVTNVTPANLPVSTAQAAAIAAKYTKPAGGIDTPDLAPILSDKLAAIPPAANGVYVVLQQSDGTYPAYTAPAGQLILFVGTAQPDASVRKPSAWINGSVS